MSLENQGGPATAAPSPTATTQQTVTIPLDQLQAFTSIQARLAEMEAAQRAQQEAAQQEQARILAQKGQAEEALRMLREQSEQSISAERQRFSQIEERAKRYALDIEVSRALTAYNLVPGGSEQLAHLWRSQFVVEAQGESFSVRTPTYQSVGDFVSQQLSRPEYAHFLRASTQGGTATGQTIQAAQTPPAGPTAAPQPRNMGEAVILHMQGAQKAQGDARANMGLPMGLKAAR
jgi:hypothetical protein